MSLQDGSRLGPYEILNHLESGGMGDVYTAHDSSLRRTVAVKVLPAHLADDGDRLRRLEFEARAAGALSHPNILTVHDLGSHDGAPYLVTELLEGESLSRRLEQGPLPWRKAVELTAQVADGLAAAHEKGIVHRDLKLANLFYTRDGRIKILDFGLAKLVRTSRLESEKSLAFDSGGTTEPGIVLGTVDYMSPEQVEGHSADHRSDVFSLGVCLFEMITGRGPFTRSSPVKTMAAILDDEPPRLGELRSGIPSALERLVRHCLEKRREDRFQSARDLAFQLHSLAQDPPSGDSVAQAAATFEPPTSGFRRLAIRSGLLAPLALLVPLLIVAYFGYPEVVGRATGDLTDQLLQGQKGTAQVVAAAIDYNLSAMKRRVSREAARPSLRALLAHAGDPGGEQAALQTYVDTLHKDYRDRHFYSWVVADRDATLLARAPFDPRVVGRSYGYREWFTGSAERPVGDLPEIVEPRRQTGLTQAFQSTAAGQVLLVSVASPVFASPGEDEVAGVLMATLHLDTFNEWLSTSELGSRSGGCPDQIALLLNRDQLVRHPCPAEDGPRPPVEGDGFYNHPSIQQLLASDSGSSIDFQDPLRPGSTNLAVVARLHDNSDWRVILLKDRAQALAPVDGMARRIALLGLLAVAAGMPATAGLWMLVARWWRRGQRP